MPHISEGDLHAWLDGALTAGSPEQVEILEHLEGCSECSSRADAARASIDDAAALLRDAEPRGAKPPFERLVERAGRRTPAWTSPQRLGWAATVLLAIGAGWIGRAVLVERGWTDPFHPASPTVVERQAPADGRTADADEGVAGARNEAREPLPPALTRNNAAARQEIGEAERDATDRFDAAVPESPAAEEKTTERGARKAVGEVVDAVGAGEPRLETAELQARSEDPGVREWHGVPAAVTAAGLGEASGCYRLEYPWSPGLAELAGRIELALRAEGTTDGVFRVSTSGRPSGPDVGLWAIVEGDSLWVRLVAGPEGDWFTFRAVRDGRDWDGEARVLRRGPRPSTGEAMGPTRLVRTACAS